MTTPIGRLFASLHRRRMFQVGILYLGGAWALLEATDFFVQNYELTHKLLDVVILLLVLGFPAVLVITWYHGEHGRQQVVRSELAILTTLFVLAGIGTYRISVGEETGSGGRFGGPIAATVDLGPGSVAILPFTNGTGIDSLDWLGPGVSDILTSNLAQLTGANVVSSQRLFDLLRQEGREETDRIPDQFALDIAARSGARLLARGSVLGRLGDLTLDAQLIELEDGTLVGTARARGDDVFALADTVGQLLAEQVGRRGRRPPERPPLATTPDRSPLALGDLRTYREYLSELRDRWKRLDPTDVEGRLELVELYGLMPGREEEQRALLEETLALRPDAMAAYELLAALAIREGAEREADSLIARYEALAGSSLPAALAGGRLLERAGRYDEARERYRAAAAGPTALTALALITRSYLRQNRPAAARQELGAYVAAAEPVIRSQARLLLGDTFVWEGSFAASLDSYEAALDSADGPVPPEQQALVAGAVSDVQELLTSPRPALLNTSVWRLLEVGRGQKALDLIDASEIVHLSELPRLPPARHHALLYARGRAMELLDRNGEALELYGEIIEHWGDGVLEVPMMADLDQRVTALRGLPAP